MTRGTDDLLVLCEDFTPSESQMIVENSDGGKNWYMNGIFMMAESKNRNGRVYDRKELEEQVNDANKRIKETNGILGELNHPRDRIEVDPHSASHVIKEMWMNGNNAHGKALILPTPAGQIVKAILEAGVVLGVSSRGTGRVSESGMVSSFTMSTVDIVTTPSAQNAYPTAIYESLSAYEKNRGGLLTLAEATLHDTKAQKHFEKEIISFLNSIAAQKR